MDRTRAAFEAAFAEEPDDVATHMAYADFLAEQGDPRGEFIQTQLALENPGLTTHEREVLRRREEELFRAHGRGWLGELAPHLLDQEGIEPYGEAYGLVFSFTLARGWLDSLQIPSLTVEVAEKVCRCPLARLVRRLVIQRAADWEYSDPEGLDPSTPPLEVLGRAPFLALLRAFQYGATPPEAFHHDEADPPGDHNIYHFVCALGEGIPALAARMSNLEELRVFANDVDGGELFRLNVSRLRVLHFCHSYDYPLETLAGNPAFANLTHLLLHPHAADDSPLPLEQVRALLRSPCARTLTHLQLRLSDMGDEGVEELIRSGVLARLEELDLRHGRVTDVGARALAASGQLSRLRRLDLQRNRLTEAGLMALRAAGISDLRLDHQQRPGPEGYSDLYTFEGDWE